jgi:hypothetical protein
VVGNFCGVERCSAASKHILTVWFPFSGEGVRRPNCFKRERGSSSFPSHRRAWSNILLRIFEGLCDFLLFFDATDLLVLCDQHILSSSFGCHMLQIWSDLVDYNPSYSHLKLKSPGKLRLFNIRELSNNRCLGGSLWSLYHSRGVNSVYVPSARESPSYTPLTCIVRRSSPLPT